MSVPAPERVAAYELLLRDFPEQMGLLFAGLAPEELEPLRAFADGVFDALEAGDILFIDSSHTADEARYHRDRLLPRLKPGVWTHHHDIMYPAAAFAEEECLALDFYAANADRFSVLLGAAYLRFHHNAEIVRHLPCLTPLARTGTSLWARRREFARAA